MTYGLLHDFSTGVLAALLIGGYVVLGLIISLLERPLVKRSTAEGHNEVGGLIFATSVRRGARASGTERLGCVQQSGSERGRGRCGAVLPRALCDRPTGANATPGAYTTTRL